MLKHYLTLKISFPTTDREVRQAYLDLVKKFSPERHPEAFARIVEAYEALKDETSRIHTELKGFTEINYPEEEILILSRLKNLYGSQIGLRELLRVEKKRSLRKRGG